MSVIERVRRVHSSMEVITPAWNPDCSGQEVPNYDNMIQMADAKPETPFKPPLSTLTRRVKGDAISDLPDYGLEGKAARDRDKRATHEIGAAMAEMSIAGKSGNLKDYERARENFINLYYENEDDLKPSFKAETVKKAETDYGIKLPFEVPKEGEMTPTRGPIHDISKPFALTHEGMAQKSQEAAKAVGKKGIIKAIQSLVMGKIGGGPLARRFELSGTSPEHSERLRQFEDLKSEQQYPKTPPFKITLEDK